LGAHPENRTERSVVALQHKNYSQLIHSYTRESNEQVVGGLWISGGLKWNIPHHGSLPALYAMNQGSTWFILAIFVRSQPKS
jgi:hypothetical protein